MLVPLYLRTLGNALQYQIFNKDKPAEITVYYLGLTIETNKGTDIPEAETGSSGSEFNTNKCNILYSYIYGIIREAKFIQFHNIFLK